MVLPSVFVDRAGIPRVFVRPEKGFAAVRGSLRDVEDAAHGETPLDDVLGETRRLQLFALKSNHRGEVTAR